MAAPGAELLLAVRRDGVVPVLVVGLGGVHAEVLDDVAIVPLPAPTRNESAAPLPALAAAGAARRRRADRRPDRRAPEGHELIECNPSSIHRDGAVVVDAIAKEVAA